MNEYKEFAYYYDEVVANLDYQAWVDFIKPYLKKPAKILDLACGTGTLAMYLTFKGYEVSGLDLSDSTIEIAKEKAKINHLNIEYYVGDMTNFALDQRYDMITCFFDSVNFLKTQTEIDNLFNCVLKHLKPQGYFIFDIFSKKLFEEYADNCLIEDYQTFKIVWKTLKQDDITLKHEIEISEADRVFKESYYEYYHEIKSLNLKGFKLIKLSGDFQDDLRIEDERIIVVLQAL